MLLVSKLRERELIGASATFMQSETLDRPAKKWARYDGYRYTIPAASRQDSYLSGVYANPQYNVNFIYGLVTYRF